MTIAPLTLKGICFSENQKSIFQQFGKFIRIVTSGIGDFESKTYIQPILFIIHHYLEIWKGSKNINNFVIQRISYLLIQHIFLAILT